MHPVIAKTFGGLSAAIYFRHFVFGLIFPAMLGLSLYSDKAPVWMTVQMGSLLVVNTLLYPYSRFIYEKLVGFVLGENVFFVNAFLMMFVKLTTMLMCWGFAIFIAPLGLVYLYWHHSRASAT